MKLLLALTKLDLDYRLGADSSFVKYTLKRALLHHLWLPFTAFFKKFLQVFNVNIAFFFPKK